MSFKNRETHPSYGMLQFSRTTGGKTSLFGSSIKHRDTIKMYLRHGDVTRDLNNDWFFGGDKIVEIEMSYSQFAECITSMNMGSGVPVTIRYIEGQGRIEDCQFINKKEQFENEFKEYLNKTNEKANSLIDEIGKLFEDKKSIGKKDREDILKKLNMLYSAINSNTEFIYNQFNEQMDKTTLEAKGEIEAFMQNKINSIANMTLVEKKDELKLLENPVEISIN